MQQIICAPALQDSVLKIPNLLGRTALLCSAMVGNVPTLEVEKTVRKCEFNLQSAISDSLR